MSTEAKFNGEDKLKYIFASLRGDDFVAEGETPLEAYRNLISVESENGSLWKLGDPHRNKHAVEQQGFSYLKINIAYKEA